MYEKKLQKKKESRTPEIKQRLQAEGSKILDDNRKLRPYLANALKIRDCAHPKHKGRYDDSKDSPKKVLDDLVSKAYDKDAKLNEGLEVIQRNTYTDQGLKLYQETISKGIIDESKIKIEPDVKNNSILLIIDTTEANTKIHLHLKSDDKDTVLDIKTGDSKYLLYLEEGDERVDLFIKTCLTTSFVNKCKDIIYQYNHYHSDPKYLSSEQQLIMGDYF